MYIIKYKYKKIIIKKLFFEDNIRNLNTNL